MRILVIAEHDHRHLGAATRHAISAAARIGGDVDVLVAGHECSPVASEAAALHGVARVLLADAGQYAAQTAEILRRWSQQMPRRIPTSWRRHRPLAKI